MMFLTPRQAAERAQLSYHTIIRAISRGDLPASEPVNGRLRISQEAFDAWMSRPRREPRNGTVPPARTTTSRPARGPAGPRFRDQLRAVETANQ